MVIPSADKPLIGAALEGKEQRKETKLRFPRPRLREKRVREPRPPAERTACRRGLGLARQG